MTHYADIEQDQQVAHWKLAIEFAQAAGLGPQLTINEFKPFLTLAAQQSPELFEPKPDGRTRQRVLTGCSNRDHTKATEIRRHNPEFKNMSTKELMARDDWSLHMTTGKLRPPKAVGPYVSPTDRTKASYMRAKWEEMGKLTTAEIVAHPLFAQCTSHGKLRKKKATEVALDE